jgi:hypothetical protein
MTIWSVAALTQKVHSRVSYKNAFMILQSIVGIFYLPQFYLESEQYSIRASKLYSASESRRF